MSGASILVVDDEASIRQLVQAYLEKEGYRVHTAADGKTGLSLAQQLDPEVVVLDIMLPELDGLEVLTRLRRDSDVYVIMLTAKTEETDKVVGLSMGADDYLTKPFSPRELVARVKAALRRLRAQTDEARSEVLEFKHVRVDPGSRRAWVDDREIELTTIEFDLLHTLAQHRGHVLSREQLIARVWGYSYYGETRVVDVHVGHLRKKLDRQDLISTVRGVGYRFDDEAV